jgi:tRNA(fMet)-specific endonuclease VapC
MRRQNPETERRAATYLSLHHRFAMSHITRFEILRGLKARAATTRLANFEAFCRVNEIVPITDSVLVQAADYYACLRNAGTLIGDADLIIAATASVNGLTLVSNNTAHFGRIPGLRLDTWR